MGSTVVEAVINQALKSFICVLIKLVSARSCSTPRAEFVLKKHIQFARYILERV